MRCSIAKVEKIYQEVRDIARKYPECKTLAEIMVRKDLDNYGCDWSMTARETKAFEHKCKWLGF